MASRPRGSGPPSAASGGMSTVAVAVGVAVAVAAAVLAAVDWQVGHAAAALEACIAAASAPPRSSDCAALQRENAMTGAWYAQRDQLVRHELARCAHATEEARDAVAACSSNLTAVEQVRVCA